MDKGRLIYLVSKYVDNTISRQELNELIELIKEGGLDKLDKLVDDTVVQSLFNQELLVDQFDKESIFYRMHEQIANEKQANKRPFRLRKYNIAMVSAAAVVLVCFFLGKSLMHDVVSVNDGVDMTEINLPERDEPIIIFDDGREVQLAAVDKNDLKKEGVELIIEDSGDLVYKIAVAAELEHAYDTFQTPKGSSSTLILTDGTKVWLNSNTKLTYPRSFKDTERIVKLEGEAFFDVNHDDKKPFIVSTPAGQIKVLGTEFNVATKLKSEKTITSLVSGKVEVSNLKRSVTLVPGTQATSDRKSDNIAVSNADLKEVAAWRNGYFRFTKDDLSTVFEKVSDWYNITDFEIQHLSADRFTGSIIRTRKLSELLGQLEKISSYKFQIKEGRVIASKKEELY